MNLQEMVGIEKLYKFPKLTGDWNHSCTSTDLSDSGSDDFGSLTSWDTTTTEEEEEEDVPRSLPSTAGTSEMERMMGCTVGGRYLPKKCIQHGLEYPEDPFPGEDFTKRLRANSCIGKGSAYVILMSSDGHYFIIKRKYATVSKTINLYFSRTYPYKVNIMDFNFRIPSLVLQWVCKYLTYRYFYTRYRAILKRPFFPIPPRLALDLTVAGYMLKC